MASSNVSDWDEPLPTSTSATTEEEEEDECSPESIKRRQEENMAKLQSYVRRMAYQPCMPPKSKPYDIHMAQPHMRMLQDTYDQFKHVLDPKLRAKRIKQMLDQSAGITMEELEVILKKNKAKQRQKDDLLKRKQELYYNMLTKLERQCRTQYLNVLIKKFAKFISHLATTMRIPPQLVDPYARMQRGIFCNILLAIGVQPTSQSAIYYTSQDAIEFDSCHRLAHALLSLIIKALDSAATTNTECLVRPSDTDFEMDNYIKKRLMCAAEKKMNNKRRRCNRTRQSQSNSKLHKKCAPWSVT